jgi:hypothetical protein
MGLNRRLPRTTQGDVLARRRFESFNSHAKNKPRVETFAGAARFTRFVAYPRAE